jgi:hypothetical protein
MKENKYAKIAKIIFAIAVIVFLLYKSYGDKYHLSSNNIEYTIAKTTRYSGGRGMQSYINYIYFIDNKEYKNTIRRDYDFKDPLNKYYVIKYSKDKPEVSELDLSQEVTDALKIREAGFTNFGK